MKILHFLGLGRVPKKPMTDPVGGIERVALEIARIQVRRGAQATVASIAPEGWRGSWEGVDLRHLRPHAWAKLGHRDFRVQLSMARCALMGRFDIVHLHEFPGMRLIEKLPKVIHLHNNPLEGLPDEEVPKAAGHFWQAAGKADAQIAVSNFVGRRLHKLHGILGAAAPAANICVNQSGITIDPKNWETRDEDRARIRRELGLKDSDVLFMFAGALRREKGVVQLAQAFRKLAAEHENAFLLVVGGRDLWVDGYRPTEKAEIEIHELLAENVAQRRASFLGIVSPVTLSAYYAAADVFVLPSMFQDAFGLVILEAFASGMPAIGARSGGLPELVIDGQTGLLVDQGDVDGLCDAMRRLLHDPALRARLGAAGRQLALAMPWENTVDRLERIYDGVLNPDRVSRVA